MLTSQFKVDAGRLTTGGLGATKPIDSNDTPQGRAQNRRVDIVIITEHTNSNLIADRSSSKPSPVVP